MKDDSTQCSALLNSKAPTRTKLKRTQNAHKWKTCTLLRYHQYENRAPSAHSGLLVNKLILLKANTQKQPTVLLPSCPDFRVSQCRFLMQESLHLN